MLKVSPCHSTIKHSDVVRMGDGIKIDLWPGGDRFDSRQFNIPDNRSDPWVTKAVCKQ